MPAPNVKLVLLAGCAVLFCIYFLQILLTNNRSEPVIDVVLPVAEAPVAVEVPVEDERESWLLVVAVILKASNFERREEIRKSYINYYEEIYCPYCEKPRENTPTVRVLFFVAREDLKNGSELHEARLREEQQTYNDVVYLNHIKENMDDGKTFDVFSWIAKNVKTQFVMKTDYDSYVIMPNLVKRLQEVRMIYHPSSNFGIYYGYFIHSKEPKISGAFMAGMGYVMSFDIAHYIATADGISKIGYEDHTVANAVHTYVQHNLQVKNGKQVVFIGDRIHFHDYPQFLGPVSWVLNCKDVVIHQLKTDADYRTTHDYFSNCCSDDAQKKQHDICLNPPKTRAKCDKTTTGEDCIEFMMIKSVKVESGYLYLDDSKL